MNIKIAKALCLISILFFSNAFSSPDKSIDKLLNLSGTTKQVEQLPDLISSGFIEGFSEVTTVTEEDKILLTDAIAQSFNSSIFLNQIQLIVEKNISKNEMKTLLSWYESDLGKLITKAEIKASTDEAYKEIMQSINDLMKNTKRLEMAVRVEKLLNDSDKLVRLQKKIGLSVYLGIMQLLDPEAPSSDLEEFKAELANMEGMLQAGIKQMIYATFIYSYQGINDSDLGKYEKFLNTETYQSFNDATINGLENGFDVVISLFTTKLAKIIKKIIEDSSEDET